MEDLVPQHAVESQRIYEIEGSKAGWDKINAAGVEITTPSPELIEKITAISETEVWDKWVEKMEGKGLPGQQVFDTYLKLIKKYAALNPHFKK